MARRDGRVWRRMKRKDRSLGAASGVRHVAITPEMRRRYEPDRVAPLRQPSLDVVALIEQDVMAAGLPEEQVATEVARRVAGMVHTADVIEQLRGVTA